MDFGVCRACMIPAKNAKLVSIFRQKGKLAQFIQQLTNLKIQKLKEIPALLCTKCAKELKRAIFLRESIIKNDQNFTEFHLKISGKQKKFFSLQTKYSYQPETQNIEIVKTEEQELSVSEILVDENELQNPKLQISVINEEPFDDEQLPKDNSSSESSNDGSTSDKFPLCFSIKKYKPEVPHATSFLCQRCGRIADRTCKFCKTKAIPQHEENKTKQRRRIIQKYLENPTISITALSRLAEAPRTTVRRIIESFKSNKKTERKAGSGRKIGSGNFVRETKIVETVRLNPDLSIRTLARMFGTCPSNVQKIKARHGFFCEKKKEARKRKFSENKEKNNF